MERAFVRAAFVAPQPPPVASTGALGWARQRLFDGPFNSVLTVIAAVAIVLVIWPAIRFLLIDAVWTGSGRTDCLAETVGREVGACWPFIRAKLGQLMYGFYPEDQQWRVDLTYAVAVALLVPLLVPAAPAKGWNALLFFGVFPVLAFFLLTGDVFGLPHVETRYWGGLLVTMVISFTARWPRL